MATPPPLLEPPEAPARPYLEVRQEGAPPSRRPLPGPKAVIGRGAGCEVLLNHPSVSRRHAELERTPDGRWLVRDLRSRNGTRVNGEVVNEQALRPGDLVQIGQFTLRLFAEEAPSRMSRGPATDDTPTYSITLFRNFEPPRISAAQISTILEFGRGLLSEANGTERLRRLLRLAIGRELGGLWAYALRVSKDPEALDPFNLCDPEQAAMPPGAAERDPHVSKSVLRSVLANNEAVVANNVAHFSHHQADVSIAADTAAFSAVACPLASHAPSHGSPGAMDILYVILPPRLGSVEWMTLLSLAVEQYRQADATWTARAAAEAKIVVDKEMAMAREVQARTLPRRPGSKSPAKESGALEWALRFEPSLVVCGDYVDVISRDDGTVLLAIADVAGKGMQAALVAASLHATFHTTARMGLPLSGMVAAVNQHFREFLPDASFVTAAALLLDPRTGEGQCVNCGHLPVLAVSPDGTVRAIEGGDNTPLGVLEDAVQSSSLRLEAGEWVILYTDGLTEMANAAGQMLGMKPLGEQLGRLCAENRTCTAEELAQRLTEWLDEYRAGATVGDDRTFLIARRMG